MLEPTHGSMGPVSTGERGPKRALGRGLSALIPQAALGTTATPVFPISPGDTLTF